MPYKDKQKERECKARSRERNKEKIKLYNAKWRRENKERHDAYNLIWRTENKERMKFLVSQWRKANASRMLEIRREWCAKNRESGAVYARTRRTLKRGSGGSHTEIESSFLLACQNYQCANPNCSADLRIEKRHLDHNIPISRGGSNGFENIQWLCSTCNMKKYTKTMDEFMKSEPNSIPAGVGTRVSVDCR